MGDSVANVLTRGNSLPILKQEGPELLCQSLLEDFFVEGSGVWRLNFADDNPGSGLSLGLLSLARINDHIRKVVRIDRDPECVDGSIGPR